MNKKVCSKCRNARSLDYHAYCRDCINEYKRLNRPKYSDSSDEARQKMIARAYVGVYISRGKVWMEKSCYFCDSTIDLEKHHQDYKKPLHFKTLCRVCHVSLHAHLKKKARAA